MVVLIIYSDEITINNKYLKILPNFLATYASNACCVVQRLAWCLGHHSKAEPNKTESNRAPCVIRSSTDAPFIPLHMSWQPNPFRSHRFALDASGRVAIIVRNERPFRWIHRVALSATYTLNTWRVVHGMARRTRRQSHCNPSRAEQNRSEPNGNDLCAGLRTHWLYLFVYPESLIQFDRSASLSTRPVASLPSWGLRVAFVNSISSRRVIYEIYILYVTCQAGIGHSP